MRTISHVSLAAACGATIGALEALSTSSAAEEVELGVATVVGVGVVGTAAGLLGLVQALASRLVSSIANATGWRAWFQHATDRKAPQRDPVIVLHASALGLLMGGAALVLGMSRVIPRLLHLDDEGFAPRLGVFLVAMGLIVAVSIGLLVARAALPAFRRLDQRVRLPVPSSGPLRYLVYVAVPVGCSVIPFLYLNRDDLGIFAAPFWVLVFFVGQGVLVVCLRPSIERADWLRYGAWVIALVIGATGLVASSLLGRRPEIVAWTRETAAIDLSAAALRAMTDVDRDGESSLWGGRDCAPFDAAIHPLAYDVPGNGIDEDCDGRDASVHHDEQSVFSDAIPPESVRRYNVVWVIVDAIRADHTSLHGYEHRTTPYLEELARDSLVFERAYSQSSATMISMPSMFIGRNPGSLDWVKGRRLESAPQHTLLAERLAEIGYRTGIVFSKYVPEYIPSVQGGHEFRALAAAGPKDSPWYSGRSGVATTHAIEFLTQDPRFPSSDEPFFLTVYMPDPHHPYREHGFGIGEFGEGPEGRYDQEIAFSDRYVGFLAGFLIYSGLWDDTIFIVTSDHGEEFGEHGGKKHARTCYRESTHVPLVVHIPGIEAQRIAQPVSLIDIVPTILELLGERDAEDELDGQSLLVPVLAPGRASPDRPILCSVVSQRAKQGHFFRRAVRSGKWLLVHEMISGRYELYDTVADPDEQQDLYSKMATDPSIEALRDTLARSLQGNLARNLLTD
jgi:choline-sulfatase